MEEGFQKADSHNLPTVDVTMVVEFLALCKDLNQAESSGAKAKHSARESYGDTAIGYVQVKREQNKCTVKARICPEHKVRDKPYFVTAIIDEEAETIIEVSCLSCVASLGGCKHAIAFLMWLHRRSEEPAPTEVTCYWKKPALSQVGSVDKFIEAENIGKKARQIDITLPGTTGFLKEVCQATNSDKHSCPINLHHGKLDNVQKLSLHQMMIEFVNSKVEQTANSFMNFCTASMNTEAIKRATKLTHTQSEDSLWFELRYGRITASKLYEMAVCKKSNGTLVNQIIGVTKKFDSFAMSRGKKLEKLVLLEVQKKIKAKVKSCGFIILNDYGIIGASPDGLTEDSVIEVKCPISNKTFEKYINKKKRNKQKIPSSN